MIKIFSKNNLVKQLNANKHTASGEVAQIDAKQLYIKYNIIDCNFIDIYSYNTKIIQYDIKNNILYTTQKKYSRTTTKQQNIIINNFIKYNNSIIKAVNL